MPAVLEALSSMTRTQDVACTINGLTALVRKLTLIHIKYTFFASLRKNIRNSSKFQYEQYTPKDKVIAYGTVRTEAQSYSSE